MGDSINNTRFLLTQSSELSGRMPKSIGMAALSFFENKSDFNKFLSLSIKKLWFYQESKLSRELSSFTQLSTLQAATKPHLGLIS